MATAKTTHLFPSIWLSLLTVISLVMNGNNAMIVKQQPPEKIHHCDACQGKNQLSQKGVVVVIAHVLVPYL